jgi:predicted exporter
MIPGAAASPSLVLGAPAKARGAVVAALSYCARRAQLRVTLPVAIAVGVALSLIDQNHMTSTGAPCSHLRDSK